MRLLGRRPSHHDRRTLSLERYLDRGTLPGAPPRRDWTHPGERWGMFRNDVLGDCTCAAIGHLFQAQAEQTGRTIAIADSDVVDLYRRVGGYDPEVPSSDQGAEMIDVLKEMRAAGMASQRIGAFVAINHRDHELLEIAANMFGGIYVGADLPSSAKDQTVWDADPSSTAPGDMPLSWGGHAMAMLAYDHSHETFVSWGQPKIGTRRWFTRYITEAWAIVDSLWIDQYGLSPSGFNLDLLLADLYQIDRNGATA